MLDVIRRNSQSWMVKVIFAAIILTFVFWGANSMNTNTADVLVEVNGESIYRNEILRELSLTLQNRRMTNPGENFSDEQLEMEARKILSAAVLRKLQIQEAARLGIGVSDIELTVAISAIPVFYDGNGRFSAQLYEERLALMQLTPVEYELAIEEGILQQKLWTYLTSGIFVSEPEARAIFNFDMERRDVEYMVFPATDYRARINPDEAAIIAYYGDHKALYTVPAMAELEYINFDIDTLAAKAVVDEEKLVAYYEERKDDFVEPASYQLSQILIEIPGSAESDEAGAMEARKKAEAVLAELKAGKSFADLAMAHSSDAASRNNGGSLGWVMADMLHPSLAYALGELKAGDFSEPVRSPSGFHILYVADVKERRQLSFEDMRGDILSELQVDAVYADMRDIMAGIEEKIARQEAFEALAAEYGVTPTSTGLAELAMLPDMMGIKPENLLTVPAAGEGNMLPTAIDAQNGFIVIKVKSYNDSYVKGLDEVRAGIIEDIRDAESVRLASDAAAAAIKELVPAGATSASLGGKIRKAEKVSRFDERFAFGMSHEVAPAIFTAPSGEWVQRVFLAGDNAVIVRVADVSMPSDADWNVVSGQYSAGLTDMRKNDLINSYVQSLQKNSKIEFKASRILERR